MNRILKMNLFCIRFMETSTTILVGYVDIMIWQLLHSSNLKFYFDTLSFTIPIFDANHKKWTQKLRMVCWVEVIISFPACSLLLPFYPFTLYVTLFFAFLWSPQNVSKYNWFLNLQMHYKHVYRWVS